MLELCLRTQLVHTAALNFKVTTTCQEADWATSVQHSLTQTLEFRNANLNRLVVLVSLLRKVIVTINICSKLHLPYVALVAQPNLVCTHRLLPSLQIEFSVLHVRVLSLNFVYFIVLASVSIV
jgi:hypothetical protein